MIIRAATSEDFPDIAAIWNQVIRETLRTFSTDEKTVESLAALDPVFVAEAEGRVVGFATYGSFRGGPGYARTVEHSVYLTGAAQGQGVGRALMARLEAQARAEGHHVMVAGISGTNRGGIAFHERLGFDIVGRLPEVGHKNGQFLDLVLAQKILS